MMHSYEKDFDYRFLESKYDLEILKELGICLENLSAGLPDKACIQEHLSELHACIKNCENQVKKLYVYMMRTVEHIYMRDGY